MVLKRLWRFFKKVFQKKRKPSRRRPRSKLVHKKRIPPKKKKSPLKAKSKPPSTGILAGTITHYFPKVNAAVIQLKKPLHIGVPILIKGPKTNFRQTVGSMQVHRVPIEKGKAGQEIGLEVFKEVRPGDRIYLTEG